MPLPLTKRVGAVSSAAPRWGAVLSSVMSSSRRSEKFARSGTPEDGMTAIGSDVMRRKRVLNPVTRVARARVGRNVLTGRLAGRILTAAAPSSRGWVIVEYGNAKVARSLAV